MDKILAFDFDGTITKVNMYPACSFPREAIIKCINTLYGEGFGIIIYTCREISTHKQFEAYEDMIEYLDHYGINYHTINRNIDPITIFNPYKLFAHIYIDDCALGWNDDWTGDDIYKMIHQRFDTGNINPLILFEK